MPVVLVVDDEEDLLLTIAVLLQAEGYEVRTAKDGVTALDAIFSHPKPDVVLLDLAMPDLDGWGFVRAARADSEVRSIPIIVMTASPPDVARRDGGLEGARLIIHKPFELDQLLHAIGIATKT
jgi:CheY-like chemotaxis protein